VTNDRTKNDLRITRLENSHLHYVKKWLLGMGEVFITAFYLGCKVQRTSSLYIH